MKTTFPMLIRREFWEHKSLWIAPLIWVGLIVLFSTWGVIRAHSDDQPNVNVNAHTVEEMHLNAEDSKHLRSAISMPEESKQGVFAISFLAFAGMISVFASIVVFFYLIDCLYTERKDRSILFWKSLPVSDAEVVLSKLVVATVIVPLGVIALAAITQALMYAIFWFRLHGTVVGEIMPDWSFVAWLHSQWITLGLMLGGVLWYAPIAGYLLLLSAWAKNKVFLWAVLPPIALPVLEKVFLGSDYVGRFLSRRFTGFVQEMHLQTSAFQANDGGADHIPRMSDVFGAFHLSGVFMSTEIWLGLAAGAAMIFAAIRVRRYRDES